MASHVTDAFRYALIDSWTKSPLLPHESPLPNFQPRQQNHQRQIAVIDNQLLPQFQVTPDGITRFFPLSSNLPLRNKHKMLIFTINFEELNLDGLINRDLLSGAIPVGDLRKICLLALHTIKNDGSPPDFQIMVANGQLEAPIATVELQIEDITIREKLIVLTNITSRLIDLVHLQSNLTILYVRQVIQIFPLFSMQSKKEERTYSNVIEPTLNSVETVL